MNFQLDTGYSSQAGRRSHNEDFAALALGQGAEASRGAVAAIADGVSAGGLGKEAAQTTVTVLVRDYFATPETWDTTVALDRVITAQNTWLSSMNRRRQPEMGLTTLTALVLRGQSYTIAHVGDTRVYRWREGRLDQLTLDHVVPHPDLRHQLTRAVGQDDRLLVDYIQGEVQTGDVFLLLSDGVHGVLPATDMKALCLQDINAQAMSDALVQAALKRGTHDNVTALVVRVQGLPDALLQDDTRLALQAPVLPRFKVGDKIDGLEVVAVLADSGVNLLYQVREPQGQRLFVLKTLHPQRAHDAQERAMLAHEAWLARRMQTGRAAGHMVRLQPWPPRGSASGYYLLYEWHRGETLEQMLQRQYAFGVEQVVQIVTQAARALGMLHRQGVVHRDIKPANLHWGDDGVLRLLDLGVALSGREPESARTLHAGTPSYINPEQWPGYERNGNDLGRLPDAQSDLYALGVTLYQLLTRGRLPYGDVLPYQLGRYHRDPVAPSRHQPGVPIWLDHIALKAVARDRSQRFETAEELLLALDRGASRPLNAPPATPLLQRDPAAVWKITAAVSLLVNGLLTVWLLFLPR